MTKESGPQKNISPEHSPEKRDRFLELMERRYQNSVAALKIEERLSDESTIINAEDIEQYVDKTLGPMYKQFSDAKKIKGSAVEAIQNYVERKRNAQEVESGAIQKIIEKGKKPSEQEIGSELFYQTTGTYPEGPVLAKQVEGYFTFSFFNDSDYLKFTNKDLNNKSRGAFHQATRFSIINADILVIRESFNPRIKIHERQHFINNSIFENFRYIERHETYSFKLRQRFPLLTRELPQSDSVYYDYENSAMEEILRGIKDEILARIRDGSDAYDATGFLNIQNVYDYLVEVLSEDEKMELNQLLEYIAEALDKIIDRTDFLSDSELDNVFQTRGILVYQLIDIPLLRFPERINAIADFYKKTNKE